MPTPVHCRHNATPAQKSCDTDINPLLAKFWGPLTCPHRKGRHDAQPPKRRDETSAERSGVTWRKHTLPHSHYYDFYDIGAPFQRTDPGNNEQA